MRENASPARLRAWDWLDGNRRMGQNLVAGVNKFILCPNLNVKNPAPLDDGFHIAKSVMLTETKNGLKEIENMFENGHETICDDGESGAEEK